MERRRLAITNYKAIILDGREFVKTLRRDFCKIFLELKRQPIPIARALLKDVPAILLDEATDSRR